MGDTQSFSHAYSGMKCCIEKEEFKNSISERKSAERRLGITPTNHYWGPYSKIEDYVLKESIIIIMLLQQFRDIFACGKCKLTTSSIQDRFSPVGSFTNERHRDYLPAAKSSTDLPTAPTVVFVELLPWEE